MARQAVQYVGHIHGCFPLCDFAFQVFAVHGGSTILLFAHTCTSFTTYSVLQLLLSYQTVSSPESDLFSSWKCNEMWLLNFLVWLKVCFFLLSTIVVISMIWHCPQATPSFQRCTLKSRRVLYMSPCDWGHKHVKKSDNVGATNHNAMWLVKVSSLQCSVGYLL